MSPSEHHTKDRPAHRAGRSLAAMVFFAAIAVIAAGCVGGRTIEVDLVYDPARTPERIFPDDGPRVALIPFERGSGVDDSLGGWTGVLGGTDTFVAEPPITEAVTSALGDYLVRAGVKVVNAPAGTDPAGYSPPDTDLVIGGVVEEFSAEAVSRFGSTTLKASVRLDVFIRKTADGTVHTITVEGWSEPKTVVAFDKKIFSRTLVEVLSDAVERVFANSKLREGLGPGM